MHLDNTLKNTDQKNIYLLMSLEEGIANQSEKSISSGIG